MTYAQRRANCARMAQRYAPTLAGSDASNTRRLAQSYEASYRRWRASKRPPTREHLMGALLTARAFYSLARAAR